MRHDPPSACQPFPQRHGDDRVRAGQVADRFLRSVTQSAPSMDPDHAWRFFGEGLLLGDSPADALVAWMHKTGMGQARPMVERAIEDGLKAVPHAPEPLRRFIEHVEARPNWVDDAMLAEGARVCCLGGLAGMRALLVTGLLAGYQFSAINQTLIATGSLEKGARRRVAETTKWWVDVTRPGAMARHGAGFKNTLRVRLIHAMVRRHVAARDDWDAAELGVPVNQTDMQLTLLGFSLIYLLSIRLVGVFPTKDEGRALMHLWRYIAWVNGVDERYLFDLNAPIQSAIALFGANVRHQRMSDDKSKRLASALVDEALERRYPHMSWWMGRYNRALQLSIARLVLDKAARLELGLEVPLVPWYPLLVAPCNVVLHRAARALPGGRRLLVRRGARQQNAYLETLFGREDQSVRGLHEVLGRKARSALSF